MEQDRIYAAIIESLPVGFSVVDREGLIIDFNKAAENITGYSRAEAIGASHIAIFHGSDRESCPLITRTFTHQEQASAVETTILGKDGRRILVSVTTSPVFDALGGFIGGVELFVDITEQKRLERERKNILSSFAHDMKNPIITSGGFVQRLLAGKAGPLTERQEEYLGLVMGELNQLEWLITDFLEFSRFEATGCRPVVELLDISEMIDRHVTYARVEADRKRIAVRFERTGNDSPEVSADEVLISRVISNLIDNAVKYSGEGRTVTVRLLDKGRNVLIEVSDEGIGIAEEHLPFIFDAFYRVSRDSKGSGLGLSIAKTIVEAHGGRIWVESSPERGSTFRFTIPKRSEKPSPGGRPAFHAGRKEGRAGD